MQIELKYGSKYFQAFVMEPKTITKPGKLTKRFLAPFNNWIKMFHLKMKLNRS